MKSDHERLVVEKALELRTLSYLYGVRSSLLYDTLNGLNASRQQMKATNRVIMDFYSQFTHEVRTHLNALMGFTDILSGPEMSPTEMETMCHQLQTATQRLIKLTYDTLDACYMHCETSKGSHSEFVSSDLFTELRAISQHIHPGLPVHLDVGDDKAILSADRFLIKKLLLRYIGLTDRLGDKIKDLVVSTSQADDRVYSIRIDAAYASADTAARVLDLLNETKDGGDSVGQRHLSILNSMADMIPGRIMVHTDQERLVFFLHVQQRDVIRQRVEPAPAPAPQVLAKQPSERRPLSVIYIDDNEVSLMLLQNLLQKRSHFNVEVYSDGYSGFEAAKRSPPDVILLDIRMPGIDGYGTLRLLKAEESTRHIPVIAVSADTENYDIEMGKKSGFAGFHPKPVQYALLVELMLACREDAQNTQPSPT